MSYKNVAKYSKKLNDYQKFVKKKMEDKGIDQKHEMDEIPSVMKEVDKEWKAKDEKKAKKLNDYQKFVKKKMEDKGIDQKHEMDEIPSVMKEVDKEWKAKDEKQSSVDKEAAMSIQEEADNLTRLFIGSNSNALVKLKNVSRSPNSNPKEYNELFKRTYDRFLRAIKGMDSDIKDYGGK